MDVLVIGTGLSGLVAATEAAGRGASVTLIDQEGESELGGQACWSFGGLFLVDSPEQRRMGIRDSLELAHRDWLGTARFGPQDDNPRRWAENYLSFAAGEKRTWLHDMGHRLFPVVGWAERGDGTADGHGNSVPRFHITWGTGPGIVGPFVRKAKDHIRAGRLRVHFRHRVTELVRECGRVAGASGTVLVPDDTPRGVASSREIADDFSLRADAVIVAAGGIGGSHDMVRAQWPTDRLGRPPERMLTGVPAYVDGSMFAVAEAAGAHVLNPDRMWHYVEGIGNWDPVWPGHGIRILPGPSSLWLDARGCRLPDPCFPGFDTMATLAHLGRTGYEHSWFVLNRRIIEKEFALSGSEQNPDLTGKSLAKLVGRLSAGAPGPVQAFLDYGEDFLQAANLEDLVRQMNALTGPDPESGTPLLDAAAVAEVVAARDAQVANPFCKDRQIQAIHAARNYRGDRIMRAVEPHPLTDPGAGPLIAVRLRVLTRKTLGGLHTDPSARVLDTDGLPVDGLFAAGESAGFGGGGMHGHSALEGTFLGGCLFSGRVAGRAAAG